MPTKQRALFPDRRDIAIAFFCALSLEADAMIAMFDEVCGHDFQYEKGPGDTNSYTFGRIHQHSWC
jgi:hypothetical protein